ncbi:hypothetical protein [Streptomyces longwoodensis]|uniref:hypothetical protein n=1 Tax=Streptomyces longwoodensis TaxID=68231 RepID=UPI0036EC2D5A
MVALVVAPELQEADELVIVADPRGQFGKPVLDGVGGDLHVDHAKALDPPGALLFVRAAIVVGNEYPHVLLDEGVQGRVAETGRGEGEPAACCEFPQSGERGTGGRNSMDPSRAYAITARSW